MKSKTRRISSGGGGGGIVVEATNRKARRKELRTLAKKKKHQSSTAKHNKESTSSSKRELDTTTTDANSSRNNKRVKISSNVQVKTIPSVKNHIPIGLKKKKKKSSKYNSTSNSDDSSNDEYYNTNNNNKLSKYYDNLDEETAIALHADDVEISYLESNLGINNKKKSSKKSTKELLNREYSKNEGFGNDFGDFLMDLDNLVDRCVGNDNEEEEDDSSSDGSDDSASSKASEEDGNNTKPSTTYDSDESSSSSKVPQLQEDPYANLDEEMALALRNDDAEIAALEEKLGLAESVKSKKKLKKEFARDMGDDFGDFLDGLDKLGDTIQRKDDKQYNQSMDSDDSNGSDGAQNASEEDDESDSSEDSEEEEELEDTADHDASLTYRPTSGEDIYGNKIDSTENDSKKPTKYIPPHLRKKLNNQEAETAEDDDNDDKSSNKIPVITADPETIQHIQRQLNNILNRLSIQTIESVSKSLSKLYATYPFHDVNDCLWKNIQSACCPPYMIMSGLIPLYIGSMAGVHWLGGDSIQLGGNLVELSITKLFNSLNKGRSKSNSEGGDAQENELINKEASNLLLIVCYLYNYGVIHCSLIYDLIRDFIANFTEIDVESLLLVLSHCGQQLRSDDPSALKEIVLLVKDRAQKAVSDDEDSAAADTSRIQYMVDTITELKNNKPRKQDVVLREKTNAIKKCVGRVKTSASQLLAGKKSGSCLRVTLQDILQAETKGRWWLVGASWVGNQHHEHLFDNKSTLEEAEYEGTGGNRSKSSSKKSSNEEDSLLALASSQRMNTDARRSIFCIIMGSTDCNDAFEKLIRSGNLKPKAERDVIRVIVHCCGEEKAYNPYYAFLATRCCEYQGKSRFTLMLTFYDVFKMIDTYSVRKIANLAKLLAHLIGSSDKCLTIGVLKRIDFSPSDMSETIIFFLSIFMTTLFDSCDVDDVVQIFSHGIAEQSNSIATKKKRKKKISAFDSDDDSEDGNNKAQTSKKEDLSELRESLSVFLLQYMKQSPLNIEGSNFQACLSSAISTCEQS